MLRHYVSLALRNFRRSPGAALLNVFTLALGLVCFVIVSGFVGFWQRAEQQFPKSDRTYVVTSKRDFGDGTTPFEQAFTSAYVARYLQADFPRIERTARAAQVNDHASYVAGDRSLRITDFAADAELLEILDLPFIEGDPSRALASPRSVVLTERVARQLFGSDGALGKHIVHDGADELTVTGVVRAIPEPSIMGRSLSAVFPFDALTSRDVFENVQRARFGRDTTTGPEYWGPTFELTYVLLPADGSFTAAELRAQLPAFVARHMPAAQLAELKLELGLMPVGDVLERMTDGAFGMGGGMPLAPILWTLAGLVLAVACLNYANLAIGRAAFRARDVGVRRALGATVRQVMAQSLVECGLLTALAVAVATGAVAAIAPALETATGVDVRLALLADARSWASTVALVAAVTVVAGILPAVALAHTRPVFALHGGAARFGPRFLSTALVGAQFFVTSFLLIAMTVSWLQNRHLQQTGLARNSDPLLVVENYAALTGVTHETLRTELLRLPGVRGETELATAPWIGAAGDLVARTPDAAATPRFTLLYGVRDDFFSTFEIPILAGRGLDTARGDRPDPDPDRASAASAPLRVVIDPELAAALGFATPESAVSELVYAASNHRPYEIVGVAAPRRLNLFSWAGGRAPSLYLPAGDTNYHVVRIARDDVAGTIADIDALWKRVAPNVAPAHRFVDDLFESAFEVNLRVNQAFVGLAVFTLLIAAVGLFALALLVVGRRAREIAVRKVLGARTESIVSLLLRGFALPVLIAGVAAWPAAYVAARGYLTQFADPIAVTPWPFAGCLALTLAIATLAVGGQTWRAATPPPARALRSE